MDRELDAARPRLVLQGAQLLGRGVRGIGKSRDMARSRDQLRQQLQSLAVELGREDADPGRIAAGMGERAHQSAQHQIVGGGDDRDRPGCFLRHTGDRGATGQDRVDPGRDEHRRDLRGLLYTHREPADDLQVLAFDKPRPA